MIPVSGAAILDPNYLETYLPRRHETGQDQYVLEYTINDHRQYYTFTHFHSAFNWWNEMILVWKGIVNGDYLFRVSGAAYRIWSPRPEQSRMGWISEGSAELKELEDLTHPPLPTQVLQVAQEFILSEKPYAGLTLQEYLYKLGLIR